MAIESKIKKLPHAEVEIQVTLPWSEWQGLIGPAVEELAKDLKLPGFRPGKAPRRAVEQAFGLAVILERAAEKAIQKTHERIINEEKLEAIGSPKAEILKLAEGNELVYKIVTAVLPEVGMQEWLDSVKKVNADFKAKEVIVTTEEIEAEVSKIANSRASLVTVRRPAQDGDNVLVDFQVKRDGVPIENGTSRKHPMVLGQKAFIPGFEEQLLGMSEGEEKSFDLTFPVEYHEKSLAGKPANFKVKIALVQERQLPEIDDDFAKSISKFETLEMLKESIREGMTEERQREQKEKHRTAIVDALVEKAEIDLPHVLIHQEIHRMIDEFSLQVQSMGLQLEQYLKGIKKTQAELEEAWEPQAGKRVKASLILEKLVVDEKIEVPAEEVESEMNKTLQYYKKTSQAEKNIDMQKLYAYAKNVLANQKLFEYLEKL